MCATPPATSWRAPRRAGASQPRPVPGQRGRHAGGAGSRPYPGRGTRPRRRLAAARCATWNRWRALSPALKRGISCAGSLPPVRAAAPPSARRCGACRGRRDGGKTAGAGLAPPTAAASETANGDARLRAHRARRRKVIDIYWTRGPDHGRITGGEVDHYVDLNLVVRTRGYLEGDCVEATVQATDGGDIVEGRKTLTLHGRADKARGRLLQEPLRRYADPVGRRQGRARAGRARLPPCALTRPPPGKRRPGALRAPAAGCA